MTLKTVSDGVYMQDNIVNEIKTLDSVIFDCDGVLIDVTDSYDLAIRKTTEYILRHYANLENSDPVTSKIIDGFKATGGFNDEVDLTYATILSLVAANRLGYSGNDFVFQVIANSDQTGIKSVEKYLDTLKVDIDDIKEKLAYPGKHTDNILYSTFDQIFYGPELYYKLFNEKSKFNEKGLIENDKVIVTKQLLESLHTKFDNKIAIVTGRGIESIRYSLQNLLGEFNVKSSIFLEDKSRELAKPNPDSLVQCISELDSSHCLYVGDSMEDLIMAKKATEIGHKTTFCGIYGTSKFPEQKRKMFEDQNTSIIIESINFLPKVLNLV